MTHHDLHRPVNTDPLKVCVVVVHHRPADGELMREAMESVKSQTYPNLEAITVDNQQGQHSIGHCRNMAVEATDADLVTFLAEEDMLSPDIVASMVGLYELAKSTELKGLVHVTTNVMALLPNGQRAMLPGLTAPGIYERAYLLNNPFDPSLDYNADKAQQRKLQALAQLQGMPVTFAVTHHYGYILRAHPFRRDGIQVK